MHCARWLPNGLSQKSVAQAIPPVGLLKRVAPPPELLDATSFSGSDECAWAA